MQQMNEITKEILLNQRKSKSYIHVVTAKLAPTNKSIMYYTGWPIKNGTAYFPQYVDAITSISV